MRPVLAALFLAWREQTADLRATACYALAFAAMLTPLLTLLALKEGVIGRMTEQLTGNPATLEIIPVGAGRYDRAFFREIGSRPETAFIVPRTRTISARLLGLRSPETRKVLRGPALIPSGAGDPVTGFGPLDMARGEVVLSSEAARELGVGAGARLEAWIERRRDGRTEAARTKLTVLGIAPGENYGRIAVFAPVDLLLAVENFLDGKGEPGEGWIASALSERRESFASFRLYAPSIHQVMALRDAVEATGARVRARSDEVATVLQLDRALDWLFAVIAGVAGGGFLLSLTANLSANVERLRPTLSMFRLLGACAATRFLIPVFQSAIIVGAGTALSALGYALIALMIERRAAALIEGSVLSLSAMTIVVLTFVLLVGAALAAVVSARTAARVGADEVVRRI